MRTHSLAYTVDPNDPRAPSQELWDRLGEAERQRIVDALPTGDQMLPGEGTQHFNDKVRAFDTLRRHFDRIRRRIFIASEMSVFYPGEPSFCPDILAVADVEPHKRTRWVVSHERRGLDVVIEVLAEADPHKDLRRNVEWFPALGIPEYFVYDRQASRIHAFRLDRAGAPTYERIRPLGSGYPSTILGLDLCLEGDRLRFRHGFAPVPDADELIERLDTAVGDLLQRREEAIIRAITEEQLRLAAEKQRVAEEQRRLAEEQLRHDAEQMLAAALAELERLRR